jgi:hypothetical protein
LILSIAEVWADEKGPLSIKSKKHAILSFIGEKSRYIKKFGKAMCLSEGLSNKENFDEVSKSRKFSMEI